MQQYKIVKLPEFNYVYAVYVACCSDWEEVGRISYTGEANRELIELAKKLVSPQTIYCDA